LAHGVTRLRDASTPSERGATSRVGWRRGIVPDLYPGIVYGKKDRFGSRKPERPKDFLTGSIGATVYDTILDDAIG
jgi:hypothetical protein